jgi:hypothetical protein
VLSFSGGGGEALAWEACAIESASMVTLAQEILGAMATAPGGGELAGAVMAHVREFGHGSQSDGRGP